MRELRVVEQLAEACAVDPAAAFRRMTVFRAGDVTRPGWRTCRCAPSIPDRIAEHLPAEVPVTGDQGIALGDVAAGRKSMEQFVAQLSDEGVEALTRGHGRVNSPLGAAGNAGVFGGILETLRAKGVPPVTCTDGPSGIRLSAYASLLPCGTALASTWDPVLVRELAAEHGREMVRKGSDVLLSPGMNIHRDPLGGRNFEYFSEDPLVTGLYGPRRSPSGAAPTGRRSHHQALRRQRPGEGAPAHRLPVISERALREIYLKGFEIA